MSEKSNRDGINIQIRGAFDFLIKHAQERKSFSVSYSLLKLGGLSLRPGKEFLIA